MNRRAFLLSTAALAVAGPALAAEDYTPGLVQQHLAAGKTVFVDFKASWCSTCAAQDRVIGALRSENPAYNQNVVFVNVDWDQYGNGALAQALNIPRRSTLVVLKQNGAGQIQELGRIVAGTSRAQIKGLMDTALAAAVA